MVFQLETITEHAKTKTMFVLKVVGTDNNNETSTKQRNKETFMFELRELEEEIIEVETQIEELWAIGQVSKRLFDREERLKKKFIRMTARLTVFTLEA